MRTVFTIILLIAAGALYGQISPKITVSTEKVKVNGEVMLVHKVKGGETLYSISKAYNVTIDEIVRKNESLKAGLKEGSTIYIPSSTPAAATTDAATDAAADGVSEEKAAQKQVSATPSANLKKEYDLKKYSRKKKHTVKWWETIEDVAGKYNVSVDAIVELNSLETTILKKKQVLYIPNEAFMALYEQMSQMDEQKPENNVEDAETDDNEDAPAMDIPLSGKCELTYILPLNLRDTVGPNSSFMDFYMGSLLALELIGERETPVKVTLIDRSMYGSIDELVSSGAIDGKQTIIGPVNPSDMEKVLEATAGKSLVFSPMDSRSEKYTEGNPLFFQVPATSDVQLENIVNLFAKKSTPANNAVLIYENGGADTALVRVAKGILASEGINFSALSYGILEGREIMGRMRSLMKPEMENLVLVLSNSEAFVSDVVRNLNLICTNPVEENRRAITLFGLPRWRNFETIEVEYFHRMNLHLSLPYFVDYNNKEVKDFLMKYRALFNSEPTPFAFQGYDITIFAEGCLRSTANPIKTFSQIGEFYIPQSLQLKNNYVRNGEGNGFINRGTTDIMYNPDYTISVIE